MISSPIPAIIARLSSQRAMDKSRKQAEKIAIDLAKNNQEKNKEQTSRVEEKNSETK